MAFDLGGLARGLGAAGGGYLGGEVKGEAEGYRRQQIAANEALKRDALAQQRELVGLRRKELDPKKDIRALAAHDATQIWGMLNDPKNQDDFAHMPGFRQHLIERAQKAQGVVDGSVSPEDYLHLGHEFGDVEAFPAPGPKAEGAPLGGQALPPPDVTGLQPGQTRFDVESAAQQSALPPATTPVGGGPVRQAAGLSPGPLPFQLGAALPGAGPEMAPPPAAAPVAKAPPTPKPTFDPRAALRELASSDPLEGIVQGPTETAAAFGKRQAAAEKSWNNKLTRLTALIQAEPRADLATTKAGNEQRESDSRVVGREAGAFASTQRGLTDQAMRAPKVASEKKKVENIDSEISRRLTQSRVDEGRLTETQRHNRVTENIGWLNAKVRQASAQDQRTYRASQRQRIQYALDHAAELEIGKDDRAKLQYAGKILGAPERVGSLSSSAATGESENALALANQVFEGMASRKGRVGTPALVAPAAKVTTTTSAAVSEKLTGPAITKAEIASVKAAKAAGPGQYKAWVNGLSPNQQKRVRFAERLLPRR